MPHYKLTYFNFKGLGEPVRLMLSYMGKEFEDNRISFEEWPQLKEKTPLGKVPMLEIDGKVLYQSTAILRYLALEAGLAGNNAEENLEIDMIAGGLLDLVTELQKFARMENQTEKEKLMEVYVNKTIPFYMKKLEVIMKKNGGYLANGKLSWADIFAVGFTSSLPGFIGFDLGEKYPFFKELVERVHSLPGIKEWVEKRPVTAT